MRPSEFEQFLNVSKLQLSAQTAPEKIYTFIEWCKGLGKEEIILRLSSEDKGGWGNNCFIDFTTTRMIVSKKTFLRKFLDLGFIAGIAPYPYKLTTKNWNNLSRSDRRKQAIISPEDLICDTSNFYIWYSNIQNFVLRKGLETTIRNMLGNMVQANFLTVKTLNETYSFKLPRNKNGNFEEIFYWLKVVLPFNISVS